MATHNGHHKSFGSIVLLIATGHYESVERTLLTNGYTVVIPPTPDQAVAAEFEFFVRLNEFRPYLRISHFSVPTDISGFSGAQAIFGVDVLSPIFKKALTNPTSKRSQTPQSHDENILR